MAKAISLPARRCCEVVILVDDGSSLCIKTACERLRRFGDGSTPILVVSRESSYVRAVSALADGADDFLPAPFNELELVARLYALERRRHSALREPVTEIEGVSVDAKRFTVKRNGVPLALTPICFDLLHALVQAYPYAVSARALCNRLWGDAQMRSDTLRTHIYMLRKAFGQHGPDPLVHTVRRAGYRFGRARSEAPL